MRDILKNVFANVEIRDEDGKILLNQSNLFVEVGRKLVRDVLRGDVVLDTSKYTIEFGTSSQVPAEGDTDIIAPFPDPTQPYEVVSTITPVGTTQIDFLFSYTNSSGGNITFSEMGLFYRPLGPDPDVTPDDRANIGELMARLKTTFTSITVGLGKNVTITWKFIF